MVELDLGAGGGIFVLNRQDLDALDLAILGEVGSQLIFIVIDVEMLDVEIAFRSEFIVSPFFPNITLSPHGNMSLLNDELATVNLLTVVKFNKLK